MIVGENRKGPQSWRKGREGDREHSSERESSTKEDEEPSPRRRDNSGIIYVCCFVLFLIKHTFVARHPWLPRPPSLNPEPYYNLSFEYLGIVLKGAPRILFIIIYRPPKYSPAFVEEFTELLSMISSEFDCFAIAGDFNIHIDNAEIKTTKEIITVLNTFDLIQHVHGPTHNRGHTLDLLISRGLNISSIVIKDVALSDHFCIFFDILISVTTESRSVSVRKRCINENTSVLFMKAISLTPSISADSVDLLLDSFDSKVKNVIDDIAPIKVSKKNGRQK